MNKRGFIYGILLWLCVLFVAIPATAFGQNYEVAVNQSQILNIEGVKRVAIANPAIADVLVVSDSEVLLVGKAPGVTSLQVWTDRVPNVYSISVSGPEYFIGKQVKIEAKIVEIDRGKMKNLGVKWGNDVTSPGSFAFGQGITNSEVGKQWTNLGSYADIQAQLNLLIQENYAKMLSQPNMITLSGTKANILVGGQMPVPVSNDNGQITVEWKDYGIKLEIEPSVNAENSIYTKVKAEVSAIDWNSTHKIYISTTGISIPPLTMRKADSTIVLTSGQTMAIGGLISSEMSKDVQKIPLLGDIPILGNLFKSTSFNRNETELLIFITPTIVDPNVYVPNSTADMKKEIKKDPWGEADHDKQDKGTDNR
ncbi:MAG: type II and III secretion system protein family protein [Acidaminococcaceae bacterium]